MASTIIRNMGGIQCTPGFIIELHSHRPCLHRHSAVTPRHLSSVAQLPSTFERFRLHEVSSKRHGPGERMARRVASPALRGHRMIGPVRAHELERMRGVEAVS